VAEAFSFLQPLLQSNSSKVRAEFIGRIPEIPTSTDKEEALAHLSANHREAARSLGFEETFHAEQVHGAEIAVINHDTSRWSTGVDGLITHTSEVLLGIHVADCGALYLVDKRTGALGLLHSGKKGTELNITGQAIAMMEQHFGTRAEDLTAVLAPCIRPPHYEVDFGSEILRQAVAAGVPQDQVHDSGLCTGADLERFYSYRLEKGNTGRMLALLGRQD